MNFRLFSSILIGLVSFQYASANCSSSDISKVNSCYYNYMKAIGVPNPSSDFNTYYNYVRNNYILVSWDYVNKLCNAFGTLQYCINKDCMNVNDFKKVATYGGNSASDYVGNYYGFDYMCGDGKQQYYNSYTCLRSNSQIIVRDCSGYGNDCTSRKNEMICFANSAKTKCGSEASAYTNGSMSAILCHSHPECCSNGSSKCFELTLGVIFIFSTFQIILSLFY